MKRLILPAFALAMGVASVVLGILKAAPEAIVVLLGFGLSAISIILLPGRKT